MSLVVDVVDLTADDGDTDVDEPSAAAPHSTLLRHPLAESLSSHGIASTTAGSSSLEDRSSAKRQRVGGQPIERVDLSGGVLDDSLLVRVQAIAQQSNCVGCDGRGLALGVSEKMPYGCPYKERQRMPPSNKFAIPAHRATPGTIDVRRPPASAAGRTPIVIAMFAQWEMGLPGKYNRVQPAPPSDSASTRAGWFRQCLGAIAAIDPPLASIAFPYEIGCGLAGGDWRVYERMIVEFADANPHTRVTIARWTGGGGGRGRGSGARGAGGRGTDARGGRGTCFTCGQAGHWSSSCPRRRSSSAGNGPR